MPQDTQYLVDILSAAQRVLDYTAHRSIRDFYADVQLQDASIRRLLAIGKAARLLSSETQQAIPQVNWSAIAQIKYHLAPGDKAVDVDHLWYIINTEIPDLIQALNPSLSNPRHRTAQQTTTRQQVNKQTVSRPQSINEP